MSRMFLAKEGNDFCGQLFHGEHFSFKWSIRDYRDWLIRKLEENDAIEVCLNTAPTPEAISHRATATTAKTTSRMMRLFRFMEWSAPL